MQRSRRPTIRDVAAAANVSPTTVSHALNGKGVVKRETVERIREVASSIGYRPSAIARSLRGSKLGTLALIIRPFTTLDSFIPEGVDYFLRIVGGASLTAMERGYSLMLTSDPSAPDSPLSARAADAFIVTEPFENDPVLTFLHNQRLPFVAVGADPARRNEFVTIEARGDEQTSEALTHLVSAGAHRIALITGTDRNAWNFDAEATFRAWSAARGEDPLILAIPEAEGGRAGDIALDAFLSGSVPRPDAFLCLTGRHASGIAAAAVRRGLRVPDDLLVVAGSGSIQNQLAAPTVTSFDLRPELLAQQAVEVAASLAERRSFDPGLLLAPDAVLNVRQSTTG